jgi:hypothetical protein
MQILDGKNHRRGAYDSIALDIIVEILNGGWYWRWQNDALIAMHYTTEAIQRVDVIFLKIFRALVDQWIDSGIDENGTETPSRRYVRGLPKGYSESLFDILYAWLNRNMPKPALMNEGRIGIFDERPSPLGLDLETYARESAVFYLKELLECPAPHRLERCRNPKCRTYFARKRGRKADMKRGVYCGKCELMGAAERTKLSRQHRKNQQLDAAANAWRQWKKSNRYPKQTEWVAMYVNRQFRSWPSIHAKWVTQNIAEILKRVDVRGEAPDAKEDQKSAELFRLAGAERSSAL